MRNNKVEVECLPECDCCGDRASYDGKTRYGFWAHMCDSCFKIYGIGLGVGVGQKLVVRKKVKEEMVR